MTEIGWDDFRARYRQMGVLEQRNFYAQVAALFPNQQSYQSAQVQHQFLQATHPWTVLEIGGWDGALARGMLTLTPVSKWVNLEVAPVDPVCSDSRYQHVLIDEWPWEMETLDGDALILSHVVEHMLLDQFAGIIDRFTGDAIYIDCPVTEGPQNWDGYPGTHVIEEGWDAIEQRLQGFRRVLSTGQQRWYRLNDS